MNARQSTTGVDFGRGQVYLTPTQYLCMEVLAARHRMGEGMWTFPNALRPTLKELERMGGAGWKSGIVDGTCLGWLTEGGRKAMVSDTYTPPALASRATERLHHHCCCPGGAS